MWTLHPYMSIFSKQLPQSSVGWHDKHTPGILARHQWPIFCARVTVTNHTKTMPKSSGQSFLEERMLLK